MRCKSIAFGLLTAALQLTAAKSDVVDLTSENFHDFINSNDLVLAKFFAPWCGHCKALAPEYEVAATALKEKNIKLAKIDCTEETTLCSDFGVEGYPTLKVFRGHDDVTPYTQARKAPAIQSYMVKRSLPAVSELVPDAIEEFKESDNVVMVAYYDANDSESDKTFRAAAEKLRDSYMFGAVTDAEHLKAEGIKTPTIVLHKKFDEKRNDFTEKFDVDAIVSFAKVAASPLIGEVGPETYSDYMSAGIPLAYIFADTAEERQTLAEAMRPIAKQYKGEINFATIDSKSFGAHAGNLNLKPDSFPAFAIHDIEKNSKFPYEQGKELVHDDIAAFVKAFKDGSIQPSIKSEPIPETQEGPVTVVVAKSYRDIIMDDTKDVLIEFYAPWCGHCKALAPKYEELAEMYASSEFKDQVVIAKLDATLNDVPDEISGFPTIKMYPAGSKHSPVTYSGSRSVEDLVRFIRESGKYSADPSKKEEAVEESSSADAESSTSSTESEAAESTESATSSATEAEAEETKVPAGEADSHDEL
ncbi:Protein disulfide-isomerase [Ceratocystis platani]|uniref:Protein disulfide-isomerase n=1 Tax=Ceratocystis fimbriata f. sp. platani TaxID=88771 RepID=A0A0F8B1K5_CERFI|nr:Protein disulfide-isomerase [Ceratocystis platani]